MHVNGRLTAPPDLQAVLATNSVRRNLLHASYDRPEARGNPLDIFPTAPPGSAQRAPSIARHAREIRVQSPQLSFCSVTTKARPQANSFAAALHLGLFCPLGVVNPLTRQKAEQYVERNLHIQHAP
jgi:hypothetical protein